MNHNIVDGAENPLWVINQEGHSHELQKGEGRVGVEDKLAVGPLSGYTVKETRRAEAYSNYTASVIKAIGARLLGCRMAI